MVDLSISLPKFIGFITTNGGITLDLTENRKNFSH